MVTDRTQGCPACGLRLRAASARCAACGKELRDASVAAERELARSRDVLARRARRANRVRWVLSVVGAFAVVFVLAFGLTGKAVTAAALTVYSAPVTMMLFLFFRWRAGPPKTLVAAPLELPAGDVPAKRGTCVIGRVVALPSETLRGPLTGRPCVAFRLRGRVGVSSVDDAGAVAFALIADDGRRWLARPEVAVVPLALEEPQPVPLPVAKDLLSFLRRFGIDADLATEVVLAEARVEDGARVAVSGEVGEEIDAAGLADGYRGAPLVPTLRGGPDAPLWIELA